MRRTRESTKRKSKCYGLRRRREKQEDDILTTAIEIARIASVSVRTMLAIAMSSPRPLRPYGPKSPRHLDCGLHPSCVYRSNAFSQEKCLVEAKKPDPRRRNTVAQHYSCGTTWCPKRIGGITVGQIATATSTLVEVLDLSLLPQHLVNRSLLHTSSHPQLTCPLLSQADRDFCRAKVFVLKKPRRTTATNVFLGYANGVDIIFVHCWKQQISGLRYRRGGEPDRLVGEGCCNTTKSRDGSSSILRGQLRLPGSTSMYVVQRKRGLRRLSSS